MDGTDSSRESSVWPVAGGRWFLVVAVVSEGRWRRKIGGLFVVGGWSWLVERGGNSDGE